MAFGANRVKSIRLVRNVRLLVLRMGSSSPYSGRLPSFKKTSSTGNLRNFQVKFLMILIHLSILIHPFTSNGQSYSYRLSPQTDSLVQLLSKGWNVPDQVKVLEIIENHKPVKKIIALQNQLDQVTENERLEMELNERLGRAYKWADDIMGSYQYYTRTLYLAEKLKDDRTIAFACMEIGNNIRLGNLIEREYASYFNRAIAIFETFNDPLSQAYMFYAKLLLEPDNEQVLGYADQAIDMIRSNYDASDTLLMESLARHLNVAGIYRSGEQKMKFLREGLAVARASRNYIMQAHILNNVGFDFLAKQQFDEAIPYHLEALDVSIKNGLKGLASNAFNNLSRCYLGKGMYKEALEYFRCHMSMVFDINNDRYFENMAEMEVKHETDRVELQNDLLLSEQKLQGRQRLILIIISLLLLLVAGFIFWSRRRVTKTNEKLKALDKTKSRFFANISHELRTPLTLINAPLESLIHEGKIDDPEVRKTLETATRNGVSLLSLVEEILDLAKLDGGKLELVENPVWLHDYLQLIISGFESGFKNKGINFEYDFRLPENMTILLDENRCGKIIKNLLSNAMKFTREGGHITLRAMEGKENMIQIQVEDTGRGIHEKDLPHIFDRYYQSEQPGTKAEGGTGIGLALAKELATLHEGTLTAESTLGKGSTFTLELPAKLVREETIVQITTPESHDLEEVLKETVVRYSTKFNIEQPRLLITEDHPEMRAFVAQTLEPYFEIKQAENGKVALEILNKETIDIVISDVMMPVMDGFELLEEIRKNDALHQVSVVMLTARADNEDKLFALTLGIDDYLTKPFSASVFLARIKNILENRIKIIRELRSLSNEEAISNENLQAFIEAHDLSDRELEIMRLMAKRYSNKQIGEKLFLSTNTVKYHLKKLYFKLDITSRDEMTERAEEVLN